MAKNQVSIKINAQDNASTPIQKVTARLNETTASIKKAQAPLQKLQNSFINFSLAVPGVKLLGSAMAGLQKNVSECVTAFAAIEKSTKQLQFAQNVNLQLKAAGADLVKFSSDMAKQFKNVFSQGEIQQAISELSFDHTFDEIQKITTVAGDLASATGMTLSQAVDALSNTMNGRLSTELKRIAPELGNLNSEALKSGEAVDILGKKLAGLAEEMSGTTGSSIKAFNETVGDLKENLGEIFSDALTPMRNYFTELISNLNTVISQQIKVNKLRKGESLSSSDALSTRNFNIGKLAVDANGNFPSWWNDAVANELMYRYNEYQKGNQSAFQKSNLNLSGGDEAVANEIGLASRRFIDAMNGLYGSNKAFFKNTTDAVRDANNEWIRALKDEEEARKYAQEELENYSLAVVETAGETAASSFSGFGPNVMMGLKLRDSVNSGAMFEGLGLRGLGGGYDKSMDMNLSTENSYSVFGPIMTTLEKVTSFLEPLFSMTETFSVLNEILNPLTTIFTAMFETLDPVVSSLLKPISNCLKILGQFLGQILIPVFQMLTPVVDAVCKAFTWLYNKVLLPVGNSIITLFNWVYNSIAAVCNGLIWLYNAIVPKSKEKDYIDYRSNSAGWMSELSDSAVTNYGSTGGTSSGGASYTAARDVIVNIYYNHSFVNGDARDIAVNIRDEIKLAEALGY